MITVDKTYFDIKATLTCGQVFRYRECDRGYVVYSLDHRAYLYEREDKVVIDSDNDEYFYHYFDLDRDYAYIVATLSSDSVIADAVHYGKGIRILNQAKYEALISFIISANNHIPRIKGIIERLCTHLGEDKGDYFAFPTAEAMAKMDEDFYYSMGLGYRAPYLVATSRAVAEGRVDLSLPMTMDTPHASKYLCTLMGVGPKVADCILLFSYDKADLFPVDTWIKKYYHAHYGEEDNPSKIRAFLVGKYGDLAGYAQQYIFYYDRALQGK